MKNKLIVFLLILSMLLPCFALTTFAEPDVSPTPEVTPEVVVNTKVEFAAYDYIHEFHSRTDEPISIPKDPYGTEICFVVKSNEDNCTLKKIEKINGTTATLVVARRSFNDTAAENRVENKVLKANYEEEFHYTLFNFFSWEEEAGHELTFRLTWVNKDGIEGTSECKVRSVMHLENYIDIGVYPSKTVSVPDDEIEIEYYIKNCNSNDLSFFTLTDESLSGLVPSTTLITPQTLKSEKSITKKVTVTPQKNLTLSPRIFYSIDNTVYEDNSFNLPIVVGDLVPEVTLTCEDYSPDKAGATQIFNYTIKNNNPIAIENIRIYDSDADDAKLIYGPFTLGSGEEYSGSYEVGVWNSGYYKCKLTYKSTSGTGTATLSIRSDKQIILPADVLFKITDISPKTITESGYVTFTLSVENGTANMLENLTISEKNNLFAPVSLNVSIPSAIGTKKSTTSKEISVLINSDKTNLNFILSYAVDGVRKTIELPYEINFNTSLEIPEDDTPQKNNGENDNSLLIWILICVCILIIIALAIILLFIFRSRAKDEKPTPTTRRRVVSNYDEDDYDDDNDYYEDEPEDELDDEGVKIFKKNN